MTSAIILADSLCLGRRLTTFQLRFPRLLLAQLNTHRALVRSARSSRAVPVRTLIREVRERPHIPEFVRNQRGMQANIPLEDQGVVATWRYALAAAVDAAELLAGAEASKGQVNRLLEPFAFVDVVLTGDPVGLANFFRLRCDHAAQTEMQELAIAMRDAYESSTPAEVPVGGWHLPYVSPEEMGRYEGAALRQVSAARCARVSYQAFGTGRRSSVEEDQELAAQLAAKGHWSPFEHVCRAMPLPAWWEWALARILRGRGWIGPDRYGPFWGWSPCGEVLRRVGN